MTVPEYFDAVAGALHELSYGAKFGPHAELADGYTREVADALGLLEALIKGQVALEHVSIRLAHEGK